MESAKDLKMLDRAQMLHQWLQKVLNGDLVSMQAMQGDASFRRYFRVMTATCTLVAMDAPPPQENCRPFVAIAATLREAGLQAPEVLAADVDQGFLLLSDFGDDTYLKILAPHNADSCYREALLALATLQGCRQVKDWNIPAFTFQFMQQEWQWHKEWFLTKLLQLDYHAEEEALDKCFEQIATNAANQPQVFMHRDFHSGNLMRLASGQVGILDFQDAFIGPITYDLVSLLRDCYIDWPEKQVTEWALFYLSLLQARQQLTEVDQATFLRWFDWMGIERHLKAIFTFSRKHLRDQQSQYLQHIPRTLHYIETVSHRYPELFALHQLMAERVKPAVKRVLACVQ